MTTCIYSSYIAALIHVSVFHNLFVFIYIEGFKEAAEKFRMESGIEPSVDLDSLDERIKIREMVLKGQIQEAIALINSLHPELLDTNRYLYFHLQVKQINDLLAYDIYYMSNMTCMIKNLKILIVWIIWFTLLQIQFQLMASEKHSQWKCI